MKARTASPRRRNRPRKRPFFGRDGEAAFFSEQPVAAVPFIQKKDGFSGVQLLRRAPAPKAKPKPIPLPETLVDAIVSQVVVQELQRFQQIPVVLFGTQTIQVLGQDLTLPKVQAVQVKSAYFINTAIARRHFGARSRRGHKDFRQVKKAVRALGRKSKMLNYKGKPRSVGRTVLLGKGTPADLQAFIQTAANIGAIEKFARRKKKITKKQQLVDLGPVALQKLVQEWVYHHGIGVDCSGFVLQVAIKAREQVRAMASLLAELPGMSPIVMPPTIDATERGAASFKGRKHRGAKVSAPTDLRPGDAWVVSGGGHIRVVSAVRTVKRADGTETIEFDTAESTGGSTKVKTGPVKKTWRSATKARFGRIKPAPGSKGGNVKGVFHRIP